MYNTLGSRKATLLGFDMKPWCSSLKRDLHRDMAGFMSGLPFPAAPVGGKCFNNPNFVNGNNPSLLRQGDVYVTKQPEQLVKKSAVPNDPPQKQQEMSKRKRKRKRRNKRKHKTTTDLSKAETPMPELTKSFECVSVQPIKEIQLARQAFRTRVPSICESEDSFIVFDDRGAEDEESAIETDGDGEVAFVDESTEVSESEGMSSDSCTPHKKVRFAADKQLCEVHPMVQWSYAYQAARKGPWEEYARDRERFSKRIEQTEKKLISILNPRHREKIYQERFEPKENSVVIGY